MTQRGFSLLELLVAFAIMAMALGMIYRVSGASARQAQLVSMHQRAQVLAQSLLSLEAVPESGLDEQGESGGLRWSLHSRLFSGGSTDLRAVPLHELHVSVQWDDALAQGGLRALELVTLRPQRGPIRPRAGGLP